MCKKRVKKSTSSEHLRTIQNTRILLLLLLWLKSLNIA